MRAQRADSVLESYTLAMFTRYGDWKQYSPKYELSQINSILDLESSSTTVQVVEVFISNIRH